MRFINEERRAPLTRDGSHSIEGVVRVRGLHIGRTFQFGPVRTHDGLIIESHTPTAIRVSTGSAELVQPIPAASTGPSRLSYIAAPAIALAVGALLRRKGR